MNRTLRDVLVLGFSAWLTNCQNNPQSGTATERDSAQISNATLTRQCYAYASAQDTIRLSLFVTGERVAGSLVYQLKEKDRNVGLLDGQMRGDTLFAEYTFRSEGLESVREVAFLLKDGRAVEGYGTLVSRNGKVGFANHRDLNFLSSLVLNETDCPR